MIDLGADVNTKEPGRSLLHLATYSPDEMQLKLKCYEKVSEKARNFYDLNKIPQSEKTYASPKIVKLLLKKELSPWAKDGQGVTPYKQVERFLAKVKAEEDKANSSKCTSRPSGRHIQVVARQYDDIGFKDEYVAIMDEFNHRRSKLPPNVFPFTTSLATTSDIRDLMTNKHKR